MASKEFKAEYRELHKGEYNIYLPDNKNPNSPLLIYLHGYYGEYNTPEFMEKELPEDLINNSLNSDFILACPLCPSDFFWRTHFVITFLDYLKDEYKLDQSKIFLTGHSMGGFGTWSTAHEYPNKFTAIAPVSGGVSEINQYQAERIKNLPIWCFHNKGDEIVPPSSTEVMINTINSIGGKGKLTIYDIDDHNAYITYKNKELFEWFKSID